MVSSSNPSLSIVIPAFNEERRLPDSIRSLRSFFGTIEGLEIIIVVEKSTDRTVEFARQAIAGDPVFKLIANDVQRGKGFAVRTGMNLARGETVFFMDADLSTPLAEVFQFMVEFQKRPEIDILIGSRAEAKSQILRKQSWARETMGRCFNRFVLALGVSGIRDTQCGFKAFRRKTVGPIFSRQKTDGFAFDVEVLLLAEKLGFKVAAIPVRWVNSPDSKVRIWIDPLKMLFDLLRIKQIVRRTLKAEPHAQEPSKPL